MLNHPLGSFVNQGQEYVITKPKTPATWYNYLFNDSYYMEVSQTGQGKSAVFHPKHRTFTRGYKYFYLKDEQSGEVWCPGYQPLKSGMDEYRCIHALGWSEIQSLAQGVDSSIRVFVPRTGMNEVWTVTLVNRSSQARKLSLFSAFGLENGKVMGSKCAYDETAQILSSFSFPYHVNYEDKEKNDHHTNYVYLFSDRPADSYDCSERRFFGGDEINELPAAVQNGRCSNKPAESENPAGVLHHAVTLEPGEKAVIHLVMGCAGSLEEAAARKAELLACGVEPMREEVERYWTEISNRFTIRTPDENVDAFMNHWLKKQIVLQTRSNRMSHYFPIRNPLQDAMGYAMLDAYEALDYMISILQGQQKNGFIEQWIVTDGSAPAKMCLLTHKDGPIWLVLCFTAVIHQAGEASLLDRRAGFKDTDEEASIYEHLLLAIDYMAGDLGAHGLSLMGDGDWNDPINGPGRLGRGESAWSSMALSYALSTLLPFCRQRGDRQAVRRLEALIRQLDEAINTHAWDGQWYVAGFDDNGEAFGTAGDEEGKLFLNTQTWAIMSGVARGERLAQVMKAIDSLDTPFGPRLLAPSFSRWNPKWGRISVKLEGTTENGSVYCHASMFKAFADCVSGRSEHAFETIKRTLPTNPDNPPESNLQVPLFVPNFYFGLPQSPNFGQSSHRNQTGTVSWMMLTMLDYVLGVRATAEGLLLDPCVPGDWETYQVSRTFRNARYDIMITRSASAGNSIKSVTVNGSQWPGKVLPYQEGQHYQVEAVIG